MEEKRLPEFKSDFLREIATSLQHGSEALGTADGGNGLQITSYEVPDQQGLYAIFCVHDLWFELLCSEDRQLTFGVRSAQDRTLYKKLMEISDITVPGDGAVIAQNYEAAITAGLSLQHDSVYVEGMEAYDRIEGLWRGLSRKTLH